MPSCNLLSLSRSFTCHLRAVDKVAFFNLVLPQIVRPVFERAQAPGIIALVDLGWVRRVLELPVFCHTAVKPSWVALGPVAADLTASVGLELLLLGLLLLF